MVITSTQVKRVAVAVGWLLLLEAGAADARELSGSAIDVDRDGVQDRVVVHAGVPSIVTLWLSERDATHLLPVAGVLERIVARDLDGDADTDLVAIDEAGDLTIWTNRGNRFRREHSRRLRRAALADTGLEMSRVVVRMPGDETTAEKRPGWPDFLPPARGPSFSGLRHFSPCPRLAHDKITLPSNPRSPPAFA